MIPHLFFWVAFTFMLVHEMDAIRCKEWELFIGLSSLPEKWGYMGFTLLHIPLYIVLFSALWYEDGTLNTNLIFWLNQFFILHAGLHAIFLKHPKNKFKDFTSWLIISGAAIFALLDLLNTGV
jgi:hypothetical protein